MPGTGIRLSHDETHCASQSPSTGHQVQTMSYQLSFVDQRLAETYLSNLLPGPLVGCPAKSYMHCTLSHLHWYILKFPRLRLPTVDDASHGEVDC